MPTTRSSYPVLDRWLNIAGVVLLVVVSAVILSRPLAMTVPADGDLPPGGDFAAFYGAGQIANDGDYSVLYDLEAQRRIQQPLTVSDEGRFWYFSYPPVVATVFGGFAILPFKTATVVYTALMLAAWVLAGWLARPLLPRLFEGHWALVVGVSLLFWSTFKAVSGGNNTAFTVLVLVGMWRLLEAEREIMAGLMGSVLLFKPTFGVALLLVWILARRNRLLLGALTGAVAFGVANGVVAGWAWLGEWVRQAISFGNADAVVNGVSASSLLGFAQNLSGGSRNALVIAAIGLAGVLWVAVVWLWRNESDFGTLIAFTSVVFVLGSPHAMAHEVAVALLAVGVIVDRSSMSRVSISLIVGLLVALSWANELQIEIGWSPAFPMILAIGVATAVEGRRWMAAGKRSPASMVTPL